MKREAWNHPKIRLLARDLQINLNEARGLVGSVWMFASISFPRGDIGRMSNEELAIAVDWDGDADQLITALVKRRLLDELPDTEGRLYIHDWHEHCEDYVDKRVAYGDDVYANGIRTRRPTLSEMKAEKAARDAVGECLTNSDKNGQRQRKSATAGESPRISPKPVPVPKTKPVPEPVPVPEPSFGAATERIQPTTSNTPPPSAKNVKKQPSLEFEEADWDELVSIWTKKNEPGTGEFAKATFRRLLKAGEDPQCILDAARKQAEYDRIISKPDRFRKGLGSWLSDGWKASLNLDLDSARAEVQRLDSPQPPTMAEQLAALNELDRKPSAMSLIIADFKKGLPDGNNR